MQFDSTSYMKQDLDYQRKLLRNFIKRRENLSQYDNYSLIMQLRNNHPRYYIVWRENDKECRQYLGKNKIHLIQQLKEKQFLDQAISCCKFNILTLECALRDYAPLDASIVTERNSKAYSNPDDFNMLLFGQPSRSQWQRRMQHEKNKFPVYKPLQLKHKAIDQTMTRSKSEALIYNLLCAKNCSFIYELPTYFGSELMLPDFTVYDSRHDRVIIIEHMGLFSSGTYCEDQTKKLQTYISHGWVPNVNLLLTFDDINGNIDTNAINKMIDTILS